MKLGHALTIDICGPALSESLSFYEKLGFRKLNGDDASASGAMLTDGMIRFRVLEGSEWKGSLTYYSENVAAVIASLKDLGIAYRAQPHEEEKITIADPDGFEINIVQADEGTLPPIPLSPVAKTGTFGELSLETKDLEESLAFWQKLGFSPTQYMPAQPSAWGSLADDLLTIGIYTEGHCPHDLKSPSITYFETDMAERIRLLKEEGLEIYQELPNHNEEAKEVVIRSPDGQLLFLFSI
jgi:catechol 2,3-dioxygenase-like lactoylglutathione lyase family enzyme